MSKSMYRFYIANSFLVFSVCAILLTISLLFGCKRDMTSVESDVSLQSKDFPGIETITERTFERPSMQLLYKRHLDEGLETVSVTKFEEAYYITYRKVWDTREVIYHEGPYSCRDMDTTHYCPLHQNVPDIIGLTTEGANNYRIYIKTYSNEDFYDAKRSYENDWIKRLSGAGGWHCKNSLGYNRTTHYGTVDAAQAGRARACNSGSGGTLAAADTAELGQRIFSRLFISTGKGTGLQPKGAGTAVGSTFVSRAEISSRMDGAL